MFDLLVHAVAGGAHAHLLVAEHGANAADPTSRALGEKAGLHKLDLVGSNNEVYDRSAQRPGQRALYRARALACAVSSACANG